MIEKIRKILVTFTASLLFAVPVLAPVSAVYAADEITGSLCTGADLEFNLDNSGTCDQEAPVNKVNEIIKLVINVFSLVVGIIAVIMIIFGGLKYITSGGEGSNISGAKNTILYAIIGLVVVALAQIIVKFVLAKTVQQ